MAADPYWNNVVLAMHMDGADSGVVFTDVKGKTVTAVGNAQTKTATKKFGTASAYFDGSGDYLTTPSHSDFAFGTGDFTVELWYKPNVVNTYQSLFQTGRYGTYQFSMRISDTGKLQTFFNDGSTAYGIKIGLTSLVAGEWHHISASRNSGILTTYLNGVQQTSGASSESVASSVNAVIGAQDVGGTYSFTASGYIDDLRITKGVARYTTTFTPPTSTFPDNGIHISGTVKGDEGAFAERTVRAYRRSDGALSGSTSSNGTTGVFNVSALDNTPHYVICLPSSGAENALIFDNITPI